MEEMYTWDLAGRVGLVDFRGYHTEIHEFDYKPRPRKAAIDRGC
jgi:ribonuclease Z